MGAVGGFFCLAPLGEDAGWIPASAVLMALRFAVSYSLTALAFTGFADLCVSDWIVFAQSDASVSRCSTVEAVSYDQLVPHRTAVSSSAGVTLWGGSHALRRKKCDRTPCTADGDMV